MRWFKHMSDSSQNDFLTQLEDKFGLEGYARWWKLVEAVAQRASPEKGHWSVSHPWSKWQEILKGKRKKLETFLEHLANLRKIFLKCSGNILRIEIPKLRELKDEYSRKSGHTPDSCPDNVAPDTDTDTDTDKKEESPLYPPVGETEISKPEISGTQPENSEPQKRQVKKSTPAITKAVTVCPEYIPGEWREVFQSWLDYKRERGQSYKPRGAEGCFKKLLELSGNDPAKGRLIVEQSVANNYAGLFELKASFSPAIGAIPQPRTYREQQDENRRQKALLLRKLREAENGGPSGGTQVALTLGHNSGGEPQDCGRTGRDRGDMAGDIIDLDQCPI